MLGGRFHCKYIPICFVFASRHDNGTLRHGREPMARTPGNEVNVGRLQVVQPTPSATNMNAVWNPVLHGVTNGMPRLAEDLRVCQVTCVPRGCDSPDAKAWATGKECQFYGVPMSDLMSNSVDCGTYRASRPCVFPRSHILSSMSVRIHPPWLRFQLLNRLATADRWPLA